VWISRCFLVNVKLIAPFHVFGDDIGRRYRFKGYPALEDQPTLDRSITNTAFDGQNLTLDTQSAEQFGVELGLSARRVSRCAGSPHPNPRRQTSVAMAAAGCSPPRHDYHVQRVPVKSRCATAQTIFALRAWGYASPKDPNHRHRKPMARKIWLNYGRSLTGVLRCSKIKYSIDGGNAAGGALRALALIAAVMSSALGDLAVTRIAVKS
jgi:hypothetical protein